MSLINQVLLDLDHRHAQTAHLPAVIRSVLTAPASSFTLRRIGILLATSGGLGLAALTTLAWSPSNTTGNLATGPDITSRTTLSQTAFPPATSFGPEPLHGVGDDLALATTPIVPLPEISLADPPAVAMPAAAADEADSLAAGSIEPPFVMVGPPAGDAVPAASPTAAPVAVPVLESHLEKRAQPFSPRQRAEGEYQRGLGLDQQGQGRESQLAFASALQEDPSLSAARQSLAVAMLGESRLDDAQAVLEQGLQLNPLDARLAVVLARIKVEQQDMSGAIAVLSAALPTGSASNSSMTSVRADAPEARALLATLHLRAGNPDAAIDNYRRALRQAPTNGTWWIGFGNALVAAGRGDDARDAYEHARATQGLSPELDQYVEQRLRAITR